MINVPEPRWGHVGAWSGDELVIYGGYGYDGSSWKYYDNVSRYKP